MPPPKKKKKKKELLVHLPNVPYPVHTEIKERSPGQYQSTSHSGQQTHIQEISCKKKTPVFMQMICLALHLLLIR